MQRRVQDTVHHSQENKRETPTSPPGKTSPVNKANLADFCFQQQRPLLHLVQSEIAPGHNIAGQNRCFDTSYMREKNRRDELIQAQGLIQEQEGKKEKMTLPLSEKSSQSGCRVAGLLGDRRICV